MGEGEMTLILLVGAYWMGPGVSIGQKTLLRWLIATPHVCTVFELCRIWINGTVSSEISQDSAKQTSAKLNNNNKIIKEALDIASVHYLAMDRLNSVAGYLTKNVDDRDNKNFKIVLHICSQNNCASC